MKTRILSGFILAASVSVSGLAYSAEEQSVWQGVKEDAKKAWSETKQTGKNIGKEASEDASEGWDKAKQGVGNPKPAWEEFKHDVTHPKKQEYDGTSQ